MSELLNCGWDAMHGRMVVAGGGRLKCPVSDCGYWAEKLSAESVLLSISALEAERDGLLRTMKLIRVQTEVRHARKLADFAVEHTP